MVSSSTRRMSVKAKHAQAKRDTINALSRAQLRYPDGYDLARQKFDAEANMAGYDNLPPHVRATQQIRGY